MTLEEAQSTLSPRGSVSAKSITGIDVATIHFNVTDAVGASPVDLAAVKTLLTCSDPNTIESVPGEQEGESLLVLTREWLVGAPNAVDPGEVVRITLDLAPGVLRANVTFAIELLPVNGAVIRLERTTPLEIREVMDLR